MPQVPTVTYKSLWKISLSGYTAKDETERHELNHVGTIMGKCDYKVILCDQDIAALETPIGGDEIINLVNKTLQAVAEGYTVGTWYGEDAEVLIIATKSSEVDVMEFLGV